MAVTPAGAEVSQAVATNWKKIWKKKLKPLADRRYYTKAQSDAKYSTKVESDAKYATKGESDAKYQPKGAYETAGSGYSKAESDAKYSAAGSSYSKAESDAKYAPYPTVIRGMWHIALTADAAGEASSDVISFGYTLPSAPTVHYIESGAALPLGCSGTAAAPDAAPGHLCVFETYQFGSLSTAGIYNLEANGGATSLGAILNGDTTAAGRGRLVGTWAVRPASVSTARQAPTPGASAD